MDPRFQTIADRLQARWEAGAICSLVGRGCRARVVRLDRLVRAGVLDADSALGLAILTEHVAESCPALPVPPLEQE